MYQHCAAKRVIHFLTTALDRALIVLSMMRSLMLMLVLLPHTPTSLAFWDNTSKTALHRCAEYSLIGTYHVTYAALALHGTHGRSSPSSHPGDVNPNLGHEYFIQCQDQSIRRMCQSEHGILQMQQVCSRHGCSQAQRASHI